MNFWSCRKNGLVRPIRLIHDVTTWFTNKCKTHVAQYLTKWNQSMKIVQLIGYNKRNFFFKNHAEKEERRLVPDLFLFFKKAIWGKSKSYAAYFQHFAIAFNLVYNKNKPYETFSYESRDMLKFVFLEKGLGIVSPTYFVYSFSRKIFFVLYSINWPNFIVWLLLLLEILPCCDVILFEINFISLIKPFFYTTKKWIQKFEYLENDKKFFTLFLQEQFFKNIPLACCSTDHQNKVSRLAILQIIRAKHQSRAWLVILQYCSILQ